MPEPPAALVEAAPARVDGGTRGLDPRSAVLLVVVASTALMAPGGLRFVIPALVIGVALACWEGAWPRGIGLLVAAVIIWALGWLLPVWWPNGFTLVLQITSVYLLRFAVAIGIGMHVVATTSPTRLGAAFRAWKAPRAVVITLAAMLRFFPVVVAEARAVLDAMRLRGLLGTRGMLRHPILSLERFAVPMIAASLRAGEDLSASAILRGLGSRRTPTSLIAPRFGAADLVLVLAVAALTAASLVLPSPLG